MDKNKEFTINSQYLKILEKMRGSSIFGEKIDVNNSEMLVVAAYFLGQLEGDSFKHIFEEMPKTK